MCVDERYAKRIFLPILITGTNPKRNRPKGAKNTVEFP